MEKALEKKMLENKNYKKFIDLDSKKQKKWTVKTKKFIKITKPRSKSTIQRRKPKKLRLKNKANKSQFFNKLWHFTIDHKKKEASQLEKDYKSKKSLKVFQHLNKTNRAKS